jgi:hypothetical protein
MRTSFKSVSGANLASRQDCPERFATWIRHQARQVTLGVLTNSEGFVGLAMSVPVGQGVVYEIVLMR